MEKCVFLRLRCSSLLLLCAARTLEFSIDSDLWTLLKKSIFRTISTIIILHYKRLARSTLSARHDGRVVSCLISKEQFSQLSVKHANMPLIRASKGSYVRISMATG